MRHVDLFSGIGGFALAARNVFRDYETLAFVERDPFCRKVLRKNFPGVHVCTDIHKFDGVPFYGSTDVVSGGFPCQPFSQAGNRKGDRDDRYLWHQMLRVVEECSPTWVVAENVDGISTLDNGLVFEKVHTDLERSGYDVQAYRLPAIAVDAPHRRDRWYFVARKRDAPDALLDREGADAGAKREATSNLRRDGSSYVLRERLRGAPGATADSERFGRRRGLDLGNVDDTEREVRTDSQRDGSSLRGEAVESPPQLEADAPDSGGPGLSRPELRGVDSEREGSQTFRSAPERLSAWGEHWFSVATRVRRMDDGFPGGMDRPHRRKQLKALGNAIVPQIAEIIFRSIAYAEEGGSIE